MAFHSTLVLAVTVSAMKPAVEDLRLSSSVRACKHDSQSVYSVSPVESRHAL